MRYNQWERLGALILAERSRRWRTRAEFAKASGVSARVLDDIEHGKRTNYQASTLVAIEVALGWTPGAMGQILSGGRVRREMDPELVRLMDVWPFLSADARALLVDMAERARRD